MRSPNEIAKTGAAWVTEDELAFLCNRVEHLELEGKLREVDRMGETQRANEAEAKLIDAQNQMAEIAASNADHIRWHREMEAKLAKANEDIVYMGGKLNAERAKLAKVVQALRGQATRLLPEGGVCFCDLIRDECIDEPGCVEAREALATAKEGK